MHFHIISNYKGEIIFLRRMNHHAVKSSFTTTEYISTVTESEYITTVPESTQLLDYIHMALDHSFDIDMFDLEINNPHLDEYIRPVIRLVCNPKDHLDKQRVIDEMVQYLTHFPLQDTRVINIESFKMKSWRPLIDGIYVYYNNHTSMYYVTRIPYAYEYFSNFTLKWQQINLSKEATAFLSANGLLQTTDHKLIEAYRKFIDSLPTKDVAGLVGGDDTDVELRAAFPRINDKDDDIGRVTLVGPLKTTAPQEITTWINPVRHVANTQLRTDPPKTHNDDNDNHHSWVLY